MVKNILGLLITMKLVGTNKWFHIDLPKKTLIRRLAQIAEDIDGTPANQWKIKDFVTGDILSKGVTINSIMDTYSHNGKNLNVKVVDEA